MSQSLVNETYDIVLYSCDEHIVWVVECTYMCCMLCAHSSLLYSCQRVHIQQSRVRTIAFAPQSTYTRTSLQTSTIDSSNIYISKQHTTISRTKPHLASQSKPPQTQHICNKCAILWNRTVWTAKGQTNGRGGVYHFRPKFTLLLESTIPKSFHKDTLPKHDSMSLQEGTHYAQRWPNC